MPAQVSYPGVYIQEVPSGVRTITGVATSRAAFVGAAPRGPINRAESLSSFADFERRFGGLDPSSELGYAVRQFFQNGGTDACVIRVVKDATYAKTTLRSLASGGSPSVDVLQIEALDAGTSGNGIEVRVDHLAGNPASNFNLSFVRDGAVELYSNLSMNSADARYVLNLVNGVSRFVSLTRVVTDFTALPAPGTSRSGAITDVATLLNETHNEFRISVNGLAAVKVVIQLPANISGATPAERLSTLCGAINQQVTAQANSRPEYGGGFKCEAAGDTILITSGVAGEFSSVRVLPGQSNNASSVLKLGSASGGIETDAVAAVRPAPGPPPALLTSGEFGATSLDDLPDPAHTSFRISLDGQASAPVDLGDAAATGSNLAEKLAWVAQSIQAKVRALKSNLAYQGFTCTSTGTRLVLTSGTRGAASSIALTAGTTLDIADSLKLLTGSTLTPGINVTLQGGTETPYTADDLYSAFIGSRDKREGLYALETLDLFNILCLPGVTDPGVLMDAAAYCEERRAFLIIDAPATVTQGPPTTPAEMLTIVSGLDLPKSDHAAVYYPWIDIADPLRAGALRRSAPCGTIAGLYARTDATRGVWKAPAGTEANLAGVQGLSYAVTDAQNGALNPAAVNCLRILPAFGAVCWGARTLLGRDDQGSEYKYVPVRRLALFLEESLYRGTQWVVFEPNDEPLWAQIRLNLGAFLQNLFRQGAFQGKSPREAYFVKCDRETTTQTDIDQGIVNIVVGFAPLKPAEFVIIKFQQIAPA